jgi:hypothetical protein
MLVKSLRSSAVRRRRDSDRDVVQTAAGLRDDLTWTELLGLAGRLLYGD